MRTLPVAMLMVVLSWLVVVADEAPIAGTIQRVDIAGQTLTVDAMGKGKPRQVVVAVTPGSRIVRFVRSGEGSRSRFVEEPVALNDLQPGWMVSVTTRHEGDREVADVVRVVHAH